MECPKIKRTEKSLEDLVKIIKKGSEFYKLLDEDSNDANKICVVNDAIQNVWEEKKPLNEEDFVFKVQIIDKTSTKIFFNDLESFFNDEFRNNFKVVYSRLKHKAEEVDSQVVFKKFIDGTKDKSEIEGEYMIKENKLKLIELKGEELKEFYDNHGEHMKKVAENTVETKRKREIFVKIGGHKFTNAGNIKS